MIEKNLLAKINKIKLVLLLAILIPIILHSVVFTISNPGTGTVQVTVNSAPTITSVTLYDDDTGTKTTTTTTITPNNPMTLEVNISDPDLSAGDFISFIEIKFYYDDGTGEPTSTSPDLKVVYNFTRTSPSDAGAWQVDDGLPTGSTYDPYRWTLDTNYTSFTEDSSNNKATLLLVFKPSKIAIYTPSNYWYIVVTVKDFFGSQTSSSSTYNSAQYQEISISPATLSVLIPADGSSYLAGTFSVSVISNYDFYLQFKADDWSLSVTLNDLRLYVDDDSDFANDVSNQLIYQVNTTYGPSPGWGTFSRTTWDGTNIISFSLSLYVFVSASSGVPSGTYTTTLYILVTL